MPQSYRSAIVRVAELPDETVQDMAALYLHHFDGSSEEIFRGDLLDKDEVILLYCAGRLAGFTTVKFFEREWNARAVRVVFSGDTIVSPEHWGQQRLAFEWISRAGRFKRQEPAKPLFWFLLVKGHRTFRYLSAFSKVYFPHWSEDRTDLKSLADQLARERFGGDYKPDTGIVEFRPSRGHLRESIANARPDELAKPPVRFFLERNPGYRAGHELVCVCELAAHNLKPLAARVFQKGFEDVACV